MFSKIKNLKHNLSKIKEKYVKIFKNRNWKKKFCSLDYLDLFNIEKKLNFVDAVELHLFCAGLREMVQLSLINSATPSLNLAPREIKRMEHQ